MKTLILFVILTTVPQWAAEEVRLVFARWAAYEAFDVQEQPLFAADPAAIRVDWRELPGTTIGEARSIRWGHPFNGITLDSTANWGRHPHLPFHVAFHEIGHIVLTYHHTWGDPTALMGPSTYWLVMRLNWDEQMGLLRRYDRVRPIPQELVGAWRP